MCAPVEEDVAGFEVAVDDGRTAVLVQILQPDGGAVGDAVAARPAEGSVVAEQRVQHGGVGHELAHEHGITAADAPEEALEGDDVGVLDGAAHLDLVPKLLVDEHAGVSRVELLHGHIAAVVELPLVHESRGAGAQEGVAVESVGGRVELLVHELAAEVSLRGLLIRVGSHGRLELPEMRGLCASGSPVVDSDGGEQRDQCDRAHEHNNDEEQEVRARPGSAGLEL